MGTFFLESRMVVYRAMIWVTTVANERCHVVRKIAVTLLVVVVAQTITGPILTKSYHTVSIMLFGS